MHNWYDPSFHEFVYIDQRYIKIVNFTDSEIPDFKCRFMRGLVSLYIWNSFSDWKTFVFRNHFLKSIFILFSGQEKKWPVSKSYSLQMSYLLIALEMYSWIVNPSLPEPKWWRYRTHGNHPNHRNHAFRVWIRSIAGCVQPPPHPHHPHPTHTHTHTSPACKGRLARLAFTIFQKALLQSTCTSASSNIPFNLIRYTVSVPFVTKHSMTPAWAYCSMTFEQTVVSLYTLGIHDKTRLRRERNYVIVNQFTLVQSTGNYITNGVWFAMLRCLVSWANCAILTHSKTRLEKDNGVYCILLGFIATYSIHVPGWLLKWLNLITAPGSVSNEPGSVTWLATKYLKTVSWKNHTEKLTTWWAQNISFWLKINIPSSYFTILMLNCLENTLKLQFDSYVTAVRFLT